MRKKTNRAEHNCAKKHTHKLKAKAKDKTKSKKKAKKQNKIRSESRPSTVEVKTKSECSITDHCSFDDNGSSIKYATFSAKILSKRCENLDLAALTSSVKTPSEGDNKNRKKKESKKRDNAKNTSITNDRRFLQSNSARESHPHDWICLNCSAINEQLNTYCCNCRYLPENDNVSENTTATNNKPKTKKKRRVMSLIRWNKTKSPPTRQRSNTTGL